MLSSFLKCFGQVLCYLSVYVLRQDRSQNKTKGHDVQEGTGREVEMRGTPIERGEEEKREWRER